MGTERRRVPVRAALHSGFDVLPFEACLEIGGLHGPSLLIEADVPVLLNERFAEKKLARFPIQHIEESVAIRPQHHVAGAALSR